MTPIMAKAFGRQVTTTTVNDAKYGFRLLRKCEDIDAIREFVAGLWEHNNSSYGLMVTERVIAEEIRNYFESIGVNCVLYWMSRSSHYRIMPELIKDSQRLRDIIAGTVNDTLGYDNYFI